MIPRIIHYCWFGGHEMPQEYKTYIDGWKKICPDYEVIEWNEHNFDVTKNQYCMEAYAKKKWAFVSDYARLKIIYEHGGIYLDTDVELLKDITPLIVDDIGYIGFENFMEVNTGLGFAAAPKNECVGKMLDVYTKQFFTQNGRDYEIPCPATNTVALIEMGLLVDEKNRNKIQMLPGMKVYPISYFNPLDYDTGKMKISDNTYSIHHYAESWCTHNRWKKVIKRIAPKKLLEYRLRNVIRKQMNIIYDEMEDK